MESDCKAIGSMNWIFLMDNISIDKFRRFLKMIKLVKVFLMLVIIATLVGTGYNQTYARETEGTINNDGVQRDIDDKSDELVELLSEESYLKTEELESKIVDFLKHNHVEYEEIESLNKESLKKSKSVFSNDEDRITKEVYVDGVEICFYDNGTFSVDEGTVEEELKNIRAATKTKTASNTKTIYSWVGLKMFSTTVSSKFNYNGKKATYHSGLDAHYKRGTLSMWNVSNWRKWKESSGTSYKVYAAGNFYYGFSIKGNGIMIQEMYLKNTISINKNGAVSKY